MTEISSSDHVQDGDVLVVYASQHGHTARIAARIADAIRAQGRAVDLCAVADAGRVAAQRYDLVVVGASLHKSGHEKEIATWVGARREALASVRSAFFSVSLSAAEDSDEARATTQRCVDEFCTQTGWTPDRTERIAGCLQYREYDVFTRQLMRLLMRRMGHSTDTSRDHDYTDWDAVDRFGRELAASARPAMASV